MLKEFQVQIYPIVKFKRLKQLVRIVNYSIYIVSIECWSRIVELWSYYFFLGDVQKTQQRPHTEAPSWLIFLLSLIFVSGCFAVVITIIILKKRYFSSDEIFYIITLYRNGKLIVIDFTNINHFLKGPQYHVQSTQILKPQNKDMVSNFNI